MVQYVISLFFKSAYCFGLSQSKSTHCGSVRLQSSSLGLITSLCFDAHESCLCAFHPCRAHPNYCTVLLNPHTDSGDCMAASDYKHPGWCCPFPSVFYAVVWGRIGEGMLSDCDNGWPWHQFPVSLFPVPHVAPSPLLPGYQTTIAALWPFSQVESVQTTTSLGLSRQWTQGPAGAHQHSHLVGQAWHIVHWESSQYDPVPPLNIVDLCCFWKSSSRQFMM